MSTTESPSAGRTFTPPSELKVHYADLPVMPTLEEKMPQIAVLAA
jgi:hypothetical protein